MKIVNLVVMVLVFVSGLVIGMLFSYVYQAKTEIEFAIPNFTYTCKNTTIETVKQVEYVYIHDVEEKEWETLIKDFARKHEYDEHNYNCVDFSRDAVKMLREHGYDARQVQGHCKEHPSNINHAWIELCLWYDAITGELIPQNQCIKNM
ncbi:MAG: hypothetical protein DRP74_09335 [Candidatus Omnitrophota bacterium]|nr:MAG: hypothetical protein DRP74_09335 [Candidatus Omnitrophota bacterium]